TLKKVIRVEKKEKAAVLTKPINQERSRHKRNLLAHNQLLKMLENMFCPYCGESAKTHLRWKDHSDKSLEQAKNQALKNLEDAEKRKKVDSRFFKG
ncbi:MAG: hypothetical protein KAS95_03790, partial [Candidatus Heimdallarchaeota archaeon]|nr:hypothetical protein [Candidatus Heimdallarchaeota archaeon]